MPFQEYKDIVGTAAGVVTAGQFFAPAFICKKIIQQGSTENVDPMPFVGGFGMSILMLQHGLILGETPMISVNILSFVLNFLYSSIFYIYTDKRKELISKIFRSIGIALLIVGYAQVDLRISPYRTEMVFSTIITLMLFALIGAPLKEVKTILRTKNAEILPFPLILSGSCVTFLWLLYGIILENYFMIFQNVVGFTLVVLQLVLCIMYPAPKDKKLEKSKKSN